MSGHLTLEELVAHVHEGAGDAAHLAACGECRAQARRWGAVAGGVRLLTETAPPPLAVDALPVERVYRLRPARRRWVAVAASAVAVLTVAGAGYAMSAHLHTTQRDGGGGSQPELVATLTPTDCGPRAVAAGTLESISESGGTVRVRGKLLPFEVSAETTFGHQVTATMADVTEGGRVLVHGKGTADGRSIAAEDIGVFSTAASPERQPLAPGQTLARWGSASGTVTDVRDGSFTVVVWDGYQVRITTSAATTVIKQASADLGDLKKGGFTAVVVGIDDRGFLKRVLSVQQYRDGAPRSSARPGPLVVFSCDADAIGEGALLHPVR